MARYLFIAFILFFWLPGFSQLPDSLQRPLDSLLQAKLQSIDSIQQQTARHLVAVKHEYDSIEIAYDLVTNRFQKKVDSLNNLGLSTDKFTSKIDSLNNIRAEKLAALKSKANEVNRNSLQKIEELGFPKEIGQQLEKYTAALNDFDITTPVMEGSFPSFTMDDLTQLSLPGNDLSIPSNLGDLKIPVLKVDLNQIADKINDVQSGIPEMASKENIEGQIEDKAGELAMEKLGEMPTAPLTTDEAAAKELLVSEAKKQAIDHFAGKQDLLQSAMDQISKYKQKYSSVQSITDLSSRCWCSVTRALCHCWCSVYVPLLVFLTNKE